MKDFNTEAKKLLRTNHKIRKKLIERIAGYALLPPSSGSPNQEAEMIFQQFGGQRRLFRGLSPLRVWGFLPKGVWLEWSPSARLREQGLANMIEITVSGEDSFDINFFDYNLAFKRKTPIKRVTNVRGEDLTKTVSKYTGKMTHRI